jgi:hypothetical protein
VSDGAERRINDALRERIDELIGRVQAAREEVVERGLNAVRDAPVRDGTVDGDPAASPDGNRRDARA